MQWRRRLIDRWVASETCCLRLVQVEVMPSAGRVEVEGEG